MFLVYQTIRAAIKGCLKGSSRLLYGFRRFRVIRAVRVAMRVRVSLVTVRDTIIEGLLC